MQRHEAVLLGSFFEDQISPRQISWEERLVRLSQSQVVVDNRRLAPSLGSCATMLFLGTLAEAEVSDQLAIYLTSLVERAPLQSALQEGPHRDALRRLVIGWVLKCPNQSEAVLQRRLNLALTLQHLSRRSQVRAEWPSC
jgi:hypothetical protein